MIFKVVPTVAFKILPAVLAQLCRAPDIMYEKETKGWGVEEDAFILHSSECQKF